MEQSKQLLIEIISRSVPLSDKDKEDIINNTTEKVYKKGDVLLKQGELCRHLWFVGSGIGRYEVVKENGDSFTGGFFVKGDFVACTFDFSSPEPNTANIEALDTLETVEISFDYLLTSFLQIPSAESFVRKMLEHYMTLMRNRIEALTFKSRLSAYQVLLNEYPDIEQMVSQKVIASYLDISAVHLSRLKADMKTSGN